MAEKSMTEKIYENLKKLGKGSMTDEQLHDYLEKEHQPEPIQPKAYNSTTKKSR